MSTAPSAPPLAPGVPRAGNDVVDLADPRCRGKARARRFLERVLSGGERAAVAGSPEPDRTLWIHWAAKEAAYKVRVKTAGERPVFRHAAFRVRLPEPLTGCPPGCDCRLAVPAAVRHQGVEVPVRLDITHRYVHALALVPAPEAAPGPGGGAGPPWGAVETGIHRLGEEEREGWAREDRLAGAFTRRELRFIATPPSAAVRARAKESLARFLGIGVEAVEILCLPGVGGRRGPPRIVVDGEPAPVDLSLSHHGAYVAWAFVRGPGAAP